MKWVSTVSERSSLEDAAREAAATLGLQLGRRPPDLAVVFFTPHHREDAEQIADLVGEKLGARVLVGCSAGGVIGGGKEVEQRAGLSLTAALLPDVTLTAFHVESDDLPTSGGPEAWGRLLNVGAEADPLFLLLPDPFTFEAETFVKGLDAAYPGGCTLGGLASGGRDVGENLLLVNRNVHRSGLVGVAMSGNIVVETIVAQGCRPIGEPMFVTRCRGNLLLGLDGRPVMEILQKLFNALGRRDQELFRNSLFLGIGMKESEERYSRGDFLIRNILGLDPEAGAMAIGATLRESAVVQFHLRDARTSAEDLEELLVRHGRRAAGAQPEGALLFSCLGRGSQLYGRPDHDTDAFRRHLGEIPLGGFFCNGEIGPVQGTTFLHGYTSSFGLFRSRRAPGGDG